MAESFLISVREGFEAALVVSIVLAFIRRGPQPQLARWVWAGTAAALGVAAVAGIVLHLTIEDLEGAARLRTFAVICAAAAGLLTWMIFWMRTHGRELRAHLEDRAASALAEASGIALALVAFAAVVREGLETALFLLSTTSVSSQGDVVAGTLAGLAVACVLGVALYHGSRYINLRRFFDVTGGLIILFAAGLVAKTILFVQAAGDLGSLHDSVYDLRSIRWLTGETQVGRFLTGIFGWDAQPTLEQVVGYLLFLVPVAWAYFGHPRRATSADRVAPVPAPPVR